MKLLHDEYLEFEAGQYKVRAWKDFDPSLHGHKTVEQLAILRSAIKAYWRQIGWMMGTKPGEIADKLLIEFKLCACQVTVGESAQLLTTNPTGSSRYNKP